MALVTIPGTMKCSFFYTLGGEQAMNRIYVRIGASLPSQGDCQTVANALDTWWEGNVQALISDQMAIREIEVVSIAEENGPQATFSAGFPLAGDSADPLLPNNVAWCISLRSGLTGRSARGRWYWCGLTENQVTGNLVLTTPADSIVAAMQNLIDTIQSLSANVVIASFFSAGVPRVGGPVTFVVTEALAVDQVVDSQRRRLPGRGS